MKPPAAADQTTKMNWNGRDEDASRDDDAFSLTTCCHALNSAKQTLILLALVVVQFATKGSSNDGTNNGEVRRILSNICFDALIFLACSLHYHDAIARWGLVWNSRCVIAIFAQSLPQDFLASVLLLAMVYGTELAYLALLRFSLGLAMIANVSYRSSHHQQEPSSTKNRHHYLWSHPSMMMIRLSISLALLLVSNLTLRYARNAPTAGDGPSLSTRNLNSQLTMIFMVSIAIRKVFGEYLGIRDARILLLPEVAMALALVIVLLVGVNLGLVFLMQATTSLAAFACACGIRKAFVSCRYRACNNNNNISLDAKIQREIMKATLHSDELDGYYTLLEGPQNLEDAAVAHPGHHASREQWQPQPSQV